MSAKQDRQGVRTASDLERKYQFGKTFAEIMGVATDAREAVDDVETELRNEIETQLTSITRNTEFIIMSALESYAETEDLSQLETTIRSELKIMSDGILMSFETKRDALDKTDSNLQEKFNQLYKYISFSGENGITLGTGNQAITLTLDTDGIVFSKNGEPFGKWDGDNFYSGNIVVRLDERAQFGIFAWIPRGDESLMFKKVGGQ